MLGLPMAVTVRQERLPQIRQARLLEQNHNQLSQAG